MEQRFFGFAGAVWVCDSLSGGGGDNGQITVECRAEDKRPWVALEVREGYKVNGNKDSSDEEQP